MPIEILFLCIKDSAVCDYFLEILKEVLKEIERKEVKISFIDILEDYKLVKKYQIIAIPTIIIKKDGKVIKLISPDTKTLKEVMTS
ncbi:MAG: thioredoxin domain-containing protein [Candidatus Njordarchaeales archaeon]